MTDRSLTVRGIPETVLSRLRTRAAQQHRSLNGEMLAILARAAAEGAAVSGLEVVRETPAAYALSRAATTRSAGRPESPVPLLDAVDRDALARDCRQHHIRSLAVFGSHARGDAGPDSDIDVVVEFEPGMTPGLGIVRVADALRPVFGGRRVDLVTRRGLAPRLRDRIMSEAVVLYAS